MSITRLNFNPVAEGGDDATGAFAKLDANDADLDTRVTAAGTSSGVADAKAVAAQATADTATATANKAALALSINATLRNQIINGDFDVCQGPRAFAPSAQVVYTADQWVLNANGSTAGASRQQFVGGAAGQPDNHGDNFQRLNCTSVAGASNYVIFRQPIVGIQQFSGRFVRASFWMRADAAGKKLGVDFSCNTGSGGGALANPAGQVVTSTDTNWKKFSLVFQFPDQAGTTIGTNPYTIFRFTLDADPSVGTPAVGRQSFTSLDISQVQVEIVASAAAPETPFEKLPWMMVLDQCMYFWQKSFAYDVLPTNGLPGDRFSTSAYSAGNIEGHIPLLRPMYPGASVITPYSSNAGTPTAGQWQGFVGGGFVNTSGLAITSPTEKQIQFTATLSGIPQYAGVYLQGNWTISRRII